MYHVLPSVFSPRHPVVPAEPLAVDATRVAPPGLWVAPPTSYGKNLDDRWPKNRSPKKEYLFRHLNSYHLFMIVYKLYMNCSIMILYDCLYVFLFLSPAY